MVPIALTALLLKHRKKVEKVKCMYMSNLGFSVFVTFFFVLTQRQEH